MKWRVAFRFYTDSERTSLAEGWYDQIVEASNRDDAIFDTVLYFAALGTPIRVLSRRTRKATAKDLKEG